MDKFSIYCRFPIWIQNALCCLRGIMLNRCRYGKFYKTNYDFLIESDNWNKNKILHYKEQHLKEIIGYAYLHCPYYRKKYNDAGVTPNDFVHLEDLKKFPILTKDEIVEHWKDMVSDDYKPSLLIHYHTSGTTGKALQFYWTSESTQFYWAEVWRGRARFGIHRGDLHLNFTGKLVTPLCQKKPPFWRSNRALNQYLINQQHITSENTPAIVDFINSKHFVFFVGYPSIIYSFAVLVDKLGLNISAAPKYIFTSAEKIYTFQKDIIEKVFRGTKIVEHYGFSEQAGCATQCEDGLYHEDFEMGHLELENTHKTEDGMTGELIATGFINKGMPFIRYRVGDEATFSKESCNCGRCSQSIVKIEGRNEDFILTPEGERLTRLDYWFKETSKIFEAQIVQKNVGEVIIRIVQRPGYTNAEEQSILHIIRSQFSKTLKVDFEYVDSIPRTKSGKFKFVINMLPPPHQRV